METEAAGWRKPSVPASESRPLCPSGLCGGTAWFGTTEARETQREVGGEGHLSGIQNGPGIGRRMTWIARMRIEGGVLVLSSSAPGGYGTANPALTSASHLRPWRWGQSLKPESPAGRSEKVTGH